MTQQLDMLGGAGASAPIAPVRHTPTRSQRRRQAMDERAVRWFSEELSKTGVNALVNVPRAATADPETSHEAAERICESGVLGQQQRRVLEAVRVHPGKTSAELARIEAGDDEATYRLLRQVYGCRLPELATFHVKRGEQRVCEATKSNCVTWWPL